MLAFDVERTVNRLVDEATCDCRADGYRHAATCVKSTRGRLVARVAAQKVVNTIERLTPCACRGEVHNERCTKRILGQRALKTLGVADLLAQGESAR